MPTDHFLRVRAVVNAADPIGLLEIGAPEDEYDPEVEELVRWGDRVDTARVIDVFYAWFGSAGEMPRPVAAQIARGIRASRSQAPD